MIIPATLSVLDPDPHEDFLTGAISRRRSLSKIDEVPTRELSNRLLRPRTILNLVRKRAVGSRRWVSRGSQVLPPTSGGVWHSSNMCFDMAGQIYFIGDSRTTPTSSV